MDQTYLFGPWEPDKPPHLLQGLVTARNVYAGANGYRPVKQPQPLTSAMPAQFKGGAAFVASDGTSVTLAGTASNLYQYTGAWTSLASGFSLGTEDRWQFVRFLDLAICVNGGAPQKVDLLTSATAPLGGSPPTADFVAVVRGFVVLGRTDSSRVSVAWSDQGDAEVWTPGTGEAGEYALPSGGEVMGLAGGEYGLILQRNRIVRMSYTADDAIWQFDEISANIGCAASGSVVQAGRRVFFLSDRGFMMCDGASEPVAIGNEKVDRTFLSAYSRSDLSLMCAAVDPVNTLVMWSMLGRIWVYNWALDRWSDIVTSVSAIIEGFTFDTYLDALGITDIDASSVYVDDPIYQGGSPLLIVVDLSNTLNVLTGDNMAPLIQMPFVEMVPGFVARTRRARPLTDATDGITLTLDARARLGDTPNEQAFTTLNTEGDMPIRTAARYQAPRFEVEEGVDWSFVQGIEFEFEAGGRR